MIIQDKYCKIFNSNNITRLKYDELYNFAVLVRNHKNIVSDYLNSNLLHYLDYNKFSFLKEMRTTFKDAIPSSFDAQLYASVFVAYENKFKALQKKLKFSKISFIGFDLYKRDCKNHKKGELKQVLISEEQTPLSNCLTYLARYGNQNTISYINSKIDACDSKQKVFYENILRCCGKFGFERLMNLALSKRQRIMHRYAEHPIHFNSLTFSGRCRKQEIIDYNKHYGSKINAFISLSGLDRKSFDIPVKYNKDWFGNIREYNKKKGNFEYTISFDDKNKEIRIHICKDGERYIPSPNGETVGIDVNCKHNLFALSNGETYGYNKKLVEDYCKLSTEVDKLKTDKEYQIGRRKQRKLDVLKHKMLKSEQELISLICKHLCSNGVGHVVMEDLDNGFGKCYAKDNDLSDINYNRKVKFLGLSSLKNEFNHIGRKYDIAVSTVHASYTSKMCPVCGCIEDANRQTQEEFKCVECGYENNADINASINIKNRVSEAVLRNALLKQVDNGAFEPKVLKREKVKEVLLSFRRSLIEKSRSECRKSSLTTFEYV